MKLIYIKSTMEPKNYSTIRSILKREQGEKIAPYVFKISDTKAIQEYLDKEKITYEIYQQSYGACCNKTEQSELLTSCSGAEEFLAIHTRIFVQRHRTVTKGIYMNSYTRLILCARSSSTVSHNKCSSILFILHSA